ncbi:MAG: YceI family protein [Flavobacteriales bacterium]|nr:YceI family protein [Flavobacteriales bacterium]
MKKSLITLAILASTATAGFSQKYFTRTGNINFYSDTPMEKIEADNHQVTTVIDLAKKEMVFSVLLKSFEFEKALMEEHFNEKYVESDKFPKAQFKGTFTSASEIDLKKDGDYPVEVSGTMDLHGKSQEVKTKGTFTVKGGKLSAKAVFMLIPEDYDIEIPGVVREKIAKEMKISVNASYEPYTK